MFDTLILKKIDFLLKVNSVNISFLTVKFKERPFKNTEFMDQIILPGVNLQLNLNPSSHSTNCTIIWKQGMDSIHTHFAYVEIIYLAFLELSKMMKKN